MSFLSLSCRLKLTWATGRPKRSFPSAMVTRLFGPGEDFAEETEGGPVVVVHHLATQAPAPGLLRGHHLLAEGQRQGANRLDGEAAGEVVFGVGLVELLGECVRGRGLVHADGLVEAAEDYVSGLRHEIASNGIAGVGEAVLEAGAGRVEEEAWGFDGVAGDNDGFGALEVLAAVVVAVVDSGDTAVLTHRHAGNHAAVADFGALLKGVGDVGDDGAGFGADLAALDAVAAVDAVGTVSVGAGEDGHRASYRDGNVECGAATDERVTYASHGVRAIGIAVRMAPGIVGGTGDGHFNFELFVVRADFFVGDGPVRANAISGVDLEVGGMETRGKGGPVDGTSAYAFAAVVRAEGEGVGASGDARVFPVELVGAGFVADPVVFGVPEGAGFEAEYVEAGAGEALEEDAASGAYSYDDVVHLVGVLEATHGQVNVLERAKHVLVFGGGIKCSEDGFFHEHLTLAVRPMLFGLDVMVRGLDLIGGGEGRGEPVVALLLDLPWFGFTALETSVGAWIGGASEADLVPGPGVGVVGVDGVLHEELPEAMDGHLAPDVGRCGRLAVVDGFESNVLMEMGEMEEGTSVTVLRFLIDGLHADLVGDAVLRHVLEAIAYGAVLVKAAVEGCNEGDLAVGGAVGLGDEMGEDGGPELPLFGGEEEAERW